MPDIAIRVKDLSKLYNLGSVKNQPKTIWALKEVSFELKRGQVMGVIGRNGAGKTTLLKVLSRITDPTKGSAEIYGRTGILLEVGTGFHEELTGRENIYFSGAVLGMKKKEIDRRFEEIVDFSGVEKFLDTPMKRYSSGMYVRLAFAVAAHLEPEILLVDEVLSVGDITFQKKCLDKMRTVTQEGRTILFVSHNMTSINSLCTQAILLDNGRIKAIGSKDSVIDKYMELTYKLTDNELSRRPDHMGNGRMRFTNYWLEDWDGRKISAFRSGQDVSIVAEYTAAEAVRLKNVSVAFALSDHFGNRITDLANRVAGDIWEEIPPAGKVYCRIRRLPLVPGSYTFNVFARVEGIVADRVLDAGKFEVEAGNFYSSGRVIDAEQGQVLLDHEWKVESV